VNAPRPGEGRGEGLQSPEPSPALRATSPAGPGEVKGKRLWRLLAGTVGGLLVVAALLITALRIAIAYVPDHAHKLRAWLERETRMRIEYQRLDAQLRWYGPELVLVKPRVLDEAGTQTLFTAREGRVGLDLWNFFRTGEFVAGRVYLDRPRVTIVRLPDGRIRLLGLAERPADEPPFELDRLPAGRVVIDDAAVVFRDLLAKQPPLELSELEGELRRERDSVRIEGRAELPRALGSSVEFDVRLKGSLDDREHLDARLDVDVEELRVAGLQPFVPARYARPLDGQGSVRVVLGLGQGRLTEARLRLALRNAAFGVPARQVPTVETVSVTEPRLELAAGNFIRHPTVTKTVLERPAGPLPKEVRFTSLSGDVRLYREDATWRFQAADLRLQPQGLPVSEPAQVEARWWGRPVSRFGLSLAADRVDLRRCWPLALAFAPKSFDRWAGLAPTGRVASLRLEASRERAGLAPSFTVNADVESLGVQPHGRLPGVTGLTARVAGTDERGTLELRTGDAAFDWPRQFRQPIRVQRAEADLDWRREDGAWHVATRGAKLQRDRTSATVDAQLEWIKPSVSPVLDLEASVEGIDVSTVPQYIPVGRLRERTIAWLDRAFVSGSAGNGRVSYHGPVRKFPFRGGEGEFVATADVQDMTLDYYPGFAPLEHGTGKAVFRNASIDAALASGEVGGVRLDAATFNLSDYKAPVLDIDANGGGDLRRALAFVQRSPLGPRLGSTFMGLRGQGPARYDVELLLPILSDEAREALETPAPERDYLVRAKLDGVEVRLPALKAPAERVAGTLEIHNERITVPAMRGTLLDGPFELEARPGSSRQGGAAVDITARGRAGGTRLPGVIGLPATIRMGGTTEWSVRGRIEQRGEGVWPLRFDVSSSLAGLTIDAPRPFAKDADETRATQVQLDILGGPAPRTDVTLASGSARARLRFVDDDGRWRLDRGAARFDGRPAALGAQPGLLVAGAWPQFDLGEWLALGEGTTTSAGGGSEQRLMDWLGPVDVQLDRATVFGFEFPDVSARLRGEGDAWHIGVSGPNAEGEVVVPTELSRGRPIVLDMRRLHLVSTPEGEKAGTTPQTDPRKLPAITARADDFAWRGRRFGRLEAAIVRDSRGLTIESLRTVAPGFEITAKGSWYMENGAPRTRLEGSFASTDFREAARWLGYRDAVDAENARLTASLWWPGGPSGEAVHNLTGTLRLELEDGRLRNVEPGAGRVLGLLSVAQLPRRLSFDFRDVTDQGLAFDSVKGDFELRGGNAYTQNLVLKGPAVDIGVVGRTGLATEDYDQTMVVSGNTSGPLAVAGALAAGPVVGAGVLVLSQLFKDQLQGLARVYYHVSGPWSAPVVQRISAPSDEAPPDAQADAGTLRSQS
jgi:uncharacterized protein (TIGR02099 family)